MKFKAGQKVRVNRNLEDIENFNHGYMKEMAELEGKIVTISRINSDGSIHIKEDSYKYYWDKRAFSLLKTTKQELLDMPVGTKIYTDAEDEDYQEWIKTSGKCFYNDENREYISKFNINEDLTLCDTNEDYGTKIIKIEEPTYETIYDESTEVQEMTVAEIEKALGHAIKIIKEDN